MRNNKLVGLAAAVLSGLFVLSTSVDPAVARSGGGHGGNAPGGGGGGHSYSGGGGHGGGGGRSYSGGGGRSYSGGHARPSSAPQGNRSGSRVYGNHRGHGHHGRGHHRHHRFVGIPYGYAYDYGYYGGSCAYEYRRAVETGSSYWWNRYQDCID